MNKDFIGKKKRKDFPAKSGVSHRVDRAMLAVREM